ncbi:MAG: hemerythrin domain-containing protein [Candidatus Hadarchaeota archaeon]
MNEVVKRIASEHEAVLQKLAEIKSRLKMKSSQKNTWKALKDLMNVLAEVKPHYVTERDFIFPELKKSARNNGVVDLLDLDHDYLEGMSLMIGGIVKNVIKNKDEKSQKFAISYSFRVINSLEQHFSLEKSHIFSLCNKLTKEQQKKIMENWAT